MGDQKFGVEAVACRHIAESIKQLRELDVEIAVVVGGGNIFRGNDRKVFGFERTPADQIGMLATAINGIVLQQTLHSLGCESRVMSAFSCASFVETFHYQTAIDCLKKKQVLIFVGGTGHPYFTTDTAAALRASEIHAEMLLKGTKVDGVYSADPKKDPAAMKYEKLTYTEALIKKLDIMDAAAIALCRENGIPIYVFNLFERGALKKAVTQLQGGSLVAEG